MRAIGRDLRTLFTAGALGGLTDGQLLDWFLTRQDDVAFEELVRRHGPMVMGVCRRGLGNHHDAEDAFQATFLVLARNGATVQPRERLAHWLHGVAWRIAHKARSAAAKRQAREKLLTEVSEPAEPAVDLWHELVPVLDQELSRLPERYRAPIVLCDLEGQGRKQAAQHLGWPEGTLSSRLSRARALLAQRLRRRGIMLSAGTLAALLTQRDVFAALPLSLVVSTAKTATFFALGSAATTAVASTQVLALTERALRTMLMSKLKVMSALFVAGTALLGAGAAGLAGQGGAKGGREAHSQDQAHPPGAVAVEDHSGLDLSKWDLVLAHLIRTKAAAQGRGLDLSKWDLVLAEDDPAGDKDDLHWSHWARQLEQVHWQGSRKASAWKRQDCQDCHAVTAKAGQGQAGLAERERNRIVRDVLVRQAVRDIEATLKRVEQDMPDRQTELEALDEIEAAVRALKEKAKLRKN